ncbi:hypothetical protein DFH06DRAFT_1345868 [Mycena polygramma]|nr:hypothetical protein DFH06DRAFT_1345868 [Mycena polygramma]
MLTPRLTPPEFGAAPPTLKGDALGDPPLTPFNAPLPPLDAKLPPLDATLCRQLTPPPRVFRQSQVISRRNTVQFCVRWGKEGSLYYVLPPPLPPPQQRVSKGGSGITFPLPGGLLSVNVTLMSDIHLQQSLLSHLALDDLYYILSYQSWWQSSEISDPGTVPLGSLSWCNPTSPDDFNPFSTFSLLNRLTVSDVAVRCWKYSYTPLDSSFSSVDDGYQGGVLLPSGWTRVATAYLPLIEERRARHLFTKTVLLKWDTASDICKGWLSQANHVQESCINTDKYYIISAIQLRISLWPYVDEFTLRGTFMAV